MVQVSINDEDDSEEKFLNGRMMSTCRYLHTYTVQITQLVREYTDCTKIIKTGYKRNSLP